MTITHQSTLTSSASQAERAERLYAGVTVTLLALVFAALFAFVHVWWPRQLPESTPRLAILLLERSPALWSLGEPWRALTSMFVHLSVPHLVTSWAALAWWFVWATKTSGVLGAERRAVAGLVVAVSANAALAGLSSLSAVGASLWIAVLVGESFARARSSKPGAHLTEAAFGAAVLLSSSVAPEVDHVGHAIGVAAGFALGLVSALAGRRVVAAEMTRVEAQRDGVDGHIEMDIVASTGAGAERGGARRLWRTLTIAILVVLSLSWGTLQAARCARSSDALEVCVTPLTDPLVASGAEPAGAAATRSDQPH